MKKLWLIFCLLQFSPNTVITCYEKNDFEKFITQDNNYVSYHLMTGRHALIIILRFLNAARAVRVRIYYK
jgi:hypothetical protein